MPMHKVLKSFALSISLLLAVQAANSSEDLSWRILDVKELAASMERAVPIVDETFNITHEGARSCISSASLQIRCGTLIDSRQGATPLNGLEVNFKKLREQWAKDSREHSMPATESQVLIELLILDKRIGRTTYLPIVLTRELGICFDGQWGPALQPGQRQSVFFMSTSEDTKPMRLLSLSDCINRKK